MSAVTVREVLGVANLKDTYTYGSKGAVRLIERHDGVSVVTVATEGHWPILQANDARALSRMLLRMARRLEVQGRVEK